jgi:Na+/H+-translocating membrane pyrophosphatase
MKTAMMMLPARHRRGVCIVTSIIGTFFVKLGANGSIMGALYKGLIASGVLSRSPASHLRGHASHDRLRFMIDGSAPASPSPA